MALLLADRRRMLRRAVAIVGLLVASAGTWVGLKRCAAQATPTPLERVERALAAADRKGDWSTLARDVQAVRSTLSGPSAGLFDLIVAMRGLEQGGAPDFDRADQACRALELTRCERRSLEEMRAQVSGPNLRVALEELAWHYADEAIVREVLQVPPLAADASDHAKERAVRTRLRLAVVAPTPDARAALLSEACAIHPASCDTLPMALERMAATRPPSGEASLLSPPPVGHVEGE